MTDEYTYNKQASDILTESERECLLYVYKDMTSKDIARQLSISPHTVDMRLRVAMRKLNAKTRSEAANKLFSAAYNVEVLTNIETSSDAQSDTSKANLLSTKSRLFRIFTIAIISMLTFAAFVSSLEGIVRLVSKTVKL